MKRRPLVGVSGPDRGGTVPWLMTARAIARAGGRAVRITPGRSVDAERLDALVLGGGADITPTEGSLTDLTPPDDEPQPRPWLSGLIGTVLLLAKRVTSVSSRGYDEPRDALELDLLDRALRRDLPVLGICRGAQLLNLRMGGSLVADTRSFYGEQPVPRSVFPVKDTAILPGTRLFDTLRKTRCRVNALHHQAVDRLGKQMRIAAREPNGIIQGVELVPAHFMIGVQWHPELLPHIRCQMRLFERLVQCAGA